MKKIIKYALVGVIAFLLLPVAFILLIIAVWRMEFEKTFITPVMKGMIVYTIEAIFGNDNF